MRTTITLLLLAALGAAPTALAQEESLAVLLQAGALKPGDRVRIIATPTPDQPGGNRTIEGKFAGYDAGGLAIDAGGARTTLSSDAVLAVERYEGDSVLDGALTGGLVFGGLGVLTGLAAEADCDAGDWFCTDELGSMALPLGAVGFGAGALLGALLDAFDNNSHYEAVYDARGLAAAEPRAKFRLRPVVVRRGGGLLLSIEF